MLSTLHPLCIGVCAKLGTRSRNASSAIGSVTVTVRHLPPSSTAIV
jgi:hypothetical protein